MTYGLQSRYADALADHVRTSLFYTAPPIVDPCVWKSEGRSRTVSGCVVCNVNVEQDAGEYCSAHNRALANIRDAYATWLEAYGKLAFKEYLERVLRLSETGERVIELAKFSAPQ